MTRCTNLLLAGMIVLSGAVGVYCQKQEATAEKPPEKSTEKPRENQPLLVKLKQDLKEFLASSTPQ